MITRAGEQKAACQIESGIATEAELLSVLGNGLLHVDEIRNQAELPVGIRSAALALPVLTGRLRRVGGKNNDAVREAQSDYNT